MTSTERREGYLTSYPGLFGDHADHPPITSIRIPLIQRDYAQGRPGRQVAEIRTSFLDVLHSAVSGGEPVGLDFVYGDVDDGTLLPLDGQQRLTTLFLLHWYLCVRAGNDPAAQTWSRFSYDTRASARRFCERLVAHTPPPKCVDIAGWVVDQPWFLHGWTLDPTISSMLTMIQSIEDRFADTDPVSAWSRLIDPDHSAVSFLLLPIEEIGAGDELYIKMNSRGKPLTAFENFKARLEQILAWSPARADELAHKIDGPWADLLWPLRGDDDIVDDEFMRLLEFVIELGEWREDRTSEDDLLHRRAALVFGADNPRADEHLSLLFDTFDVWPNQQEINSTFRELFTTSHRAGPGGSPQPVVLFGTDVQTDLFAECCREYGTMRGKVRVFPLTQTLLMYAVVLHRIKASADFPRRLRILRNLLAASGDQVRRENMPKLVADVEALILATSPAQGLAETSGFTRALVAAEREKLDFLQAHPELAPVVCRLEDHDLLRGSLGAFELDAVHMSRRAAAFTELFSDPAHWPSLTGALLAAGDYQRRRPNSEAWQFGTGSAANDGVWRTVFTGARTDLTPTREALTVLLDEHSAAARPPAEFLSAFTEAWLQQRRDAAHLDWRYYLVRYPCMREGATGVYFGLDGILGYSLCMLRRTQLNSLYRDPFLLAILRETSMEEHVTDPWFTGYPNTPRWMQLRRSSTGLRSVEAGIALEAPSLADHRSIFERFRSEREDVVVDDEGFHIRIAQREFEEGDLVDVEDRVVKGAEVLRALVEAGL